jgi:nitrous oxidase accessory protein NosD
MSSKNNGDNPNGIHVYGSLIIDSVKITSWDPEKNDVIKFILGKRPGEELTKSNYDTVEPRPFIRVSEKATGITKISNSELSYLGYSCSRCSGISFYGGNGSILKGNDIHHLLKGFYSNGMGYMTIEDNHFHDNYLYGIDPHTGTHDLVIRNNIVNDNNASGIICSKYCFNILIEGNEVYKNNAHGAGIMFSIHMVNSTARNNYVHDERSCISFNRSSNSHTVYNNTMSECSYAINLANTTNNKVFSNNIKNSINGILFQNTTNIIRNNHFWNTTNDIVFKR